MGFHSLKAHPTPRLFEYANSEAGDGEASPGKVDLFRKKAQQGVPMGHSFNAKRSHFDPPPPILLLLLLPNFRIPKPAHRSQDFFLLLLHSFLFVGGIGGERIGGYIRRYVSICELGRVGRGGRTGPTVHDICTDDDGLLSYSVSHTL